MRSPLRNATASPSCRHSAVVPYLIEHLPPEMLGVAFTTLRSGHTPVIALFAMGVEVEFERSRQLSNSSPPSSGKILVHQRAELGHNFTPPTPHLPLWVSMSTALLHEPDDMSYSLGHEM